MARSKEQLDRLDAVAASWLGTPFVHNSAVKGRGACCHKLMGRIYAEAGMVPDLDLPNGQANAPRWANSSPILEWLMGPGQEWVEEIPTDKAEPGDMILLRTGHIPHHLAMLLQDARMVHVTYRSGVEIRPVFERHANLVFAAFRTR